MTHILKLTASFRNALYIFAVSFTVRLIYLYQLKEDPFFSLLTLDSEYYSLWASDIAKGNWIGEGVFFASPLYAYFLAVLYQIYNYDLSQVIVTQFFLGSINCVIIYYLGKRLFNENVGIIAASIATFYGFFIFMEGQILKSSLSYLLSSLAFLSFLICLEKQGILWCVVGMLIGLTSLVIPNFMIFVPLLYATVIRESVSKKTITAMLAFSIGLAIIVAPVAIRNYYIGGDWVLISYNGGVNFFLGTDKETDGGLKRSNLIEQVPIKEESSTVSFAEKSLRKKLRPSEVSNFWHNRAVRIIKEDPMGYIKLLIRKTYRFWNWRELPDNLDFYYFKEKYRILNIPLLNFGMIAPLAFLGMWFSRKQSKRLIPAYAFIIFFTISVIPFSVYGRYRMPIVPILMCFAANGLYMTIKNMAARKKTGEMIVGLSIFLMTFIVTTSGNKKHNFSNMHQVLGQMYLKQGRIEESIKELKSSIKIDPQNAEAHNSLGKAYYAISEPVMATLEIEAAIMIVPNYLDAHYTLGLIYYDLGDKRATDEFKKVIELDISGDKSRIVRGLIN